MHGFKSCNQARLPDWKTYFIVLFIQPTAMYSLCALIRVLPCRASVHLCICYYFPPVPYGAWWDHYLYFWQRRHKPNLLLVKFEDLKKVSEAGTSSRYKCLWWMCMVCDEMCHALDSKTLTPTIQVPDFGLAMRWYDKIITKCTQGCGSVSLLTLG